MWLLLLTYAETPKLSEWFGKNPMALVNYSLNLQEPNDYKDVVNLTSSTTFPKQVSKGS